MTSKTERHGTVMVTGASSGIGRELALEFAPRSESTSLVARRVPSNSST